jgi:mannosyltransferase
VVLYNYSAVFRTKWIELESNVSVPEVFVTNFNKNFTGVSATTAGVVAVQNDQLDMHLVGVPLPNCPLPISKTEAISMSRLPPENLPFSIWHVRRNTEMRTAIWARDILKRPIKIVFTSAAQRRHSAYPRWLISKMDAIIATTSEAASYVDNVRAVVPHGVATQRFAVAESRTDAWKSLGYGGELGVACVGRVRPEKGTDVFVDAMLEVLPRHPKMRALIIGKTSREFQGFQQKLQQKIDDAKLTKRLIFAGETDAKSMPETMAALSLLVALPRYEGYGMTPLEGLSCGTPFVASRTGYFEKFSNNGKCGTIVEIGDVAGAVSAIEDWFLDDKLSATAPLARKFVEENHSIQNEVAGIHQVYQQLWDEET